MSRSAYYADEAAYADYAARYGGPQYPCKLEAAYIDAAHVSAGMCAGAYPGTTNEARAAAKAACAHAETALDAACAVYEAAKAAWLDARADTVAPS